MPVRVVPILDDLRWEPNAPSARFVVTDDGLALLTLRPHMDDSDRRTVVIFWTGVSRASFGGPNDEGRDQHALYSYGLSDLLWAGEVIATKRIERLGISSYLPRRRLPKSTHAAST